MQQKKAHEAVKSRQAFARCEVSEASLDFAKEIKGINNLSDGYLLCHLFSEEGKSSPPAQVQFWRREGNRPQSTPLLPEAPALSCLACCHYIATVSFHFPREEASFPSHPQEHAKCVWIYYGATWHLGALFPPVLWDLNGFPHCPLGCSEVFRKAKSFTSGQDGKHRAGCSRWEPSYRDPGSSSQMSKKKDVRVSVYARRHCPVGKRDRETEGAWRRSSLPSPCLGQCGCSRTQPRTAATS